MGATAVYDSSQSDVSDIIRTAKVGGVDYAFETAGAVPAMEVAFQITKRGGTTITTGLPDPKHAFSFPQVTLSAEERTVKGSYVGSCVRSRDIRRFIELYTQGRLQVDHLLTDTLSLGEIKECFDILEKGEAARLVVEM